MSPLVVVLIIVAVLLVLGGGGCLLCVGLAASIGADAIEGGAAPVSTPAAGLVHDAFARDLEKRLRQQGVPATQVLCPVEQSASTFECELTLGSDRAQVQVKRGAAGFEFEVPNTAFLEGTKLASSFATSIASKVDPKLRVPCFTGTLMKKVGSQFTCEVVSGTAAAGSVAVTVEDAKGNVRMDFTTTKTTVLPASPATPSPASPPRAGPRVVDFVCPAGQAPGGAVRGGCVCGSQILGTACGAPGNFRDVTETPRGCRFVCD